MTVLVTEKKLEAACAARLPGEEILAAGLFQPYGAGVAGDEGIDVMNLASDVVNNPIFDVAAGVLGGFAAQRGLAAFEHQPPFTAIAVTEDKIHAFDATAMGGAAATDKLGDEYATFDRSRVHVHMHRWVVSFNLSIEDPATKTAYQYKGTKTYKVGGKLVAHLLTGSGS